jgi:hypothetical protein
LRHKIKLNLREFIARKLSDLFEIKNPKITPINPNGIENKITTGLIVLLNIKARIAKIPKKAIMPALAREAMDLFVLSCSPLNFIL